MWPAPLRSGPRVGGSGLPAGTRRDVPDGAAALPKSRYRAGAARPANPVHLTHRPPHTGLSGGRDLDFLRTFRAGSQGPAESEPACGPSDHGLWPS